MVAAAVERFRILNCREPIARVRELALISPEDDLFTRKEFPEL